jgi:hypothetical protein
MTAKKGMRLETRTRANPARALTHHMAEGFYVMSRSIRNAEGDSAGPGKTTKKLAISESCGSPTSFCVPHLCGQGSGGILFAPGSVRASPPSIDV